MRILILIFVIFSQLFSDSKIPVSIYFEGNDDLGKRFRDNITFTILLSYNLIEIDQDSEEYEDVDILLEIDLKTSDLWESSVSQNYGQHTQYKVDFLLVGDYYKTYQLHSCSGVISSDSISYFTEYNRFKAEFDIAIDNFQTWKEIDDTERNHRVGLLIYVILGIGIVIIIRYFIIKFCF